MKIKLVNNLNRFGTRNIEAVTLNLKGDVRSILRQAISDSFNGTIMVSEVQPQSNHRIFFNW